MLQHATISFVLKQLHRAGLEAVLVHLSCLTGHEVSSKCVYTSKQSHYGILQLL